MLKKNLSAIALISLLLIMSVPAQALTLPEEEPVATFNEYEVLNHLQSLTDEQLLAEAYTEEQIKEIREVDYAAHIKEVAKLDDRTLRALRYTDEQIRLMREFDGSEEQMQFLATTLSIWVQYNDWHYEDNPALKSWVKMYISWAFAGVPGGTWIDNVVLSWSHSFRLDRDESESYATVNYYYERVYEYWDTETVYPTPAADTPGSDTTTAEFKIDMRKAINGLWCRPLDGSARVKVWDWGPKNSINLFGSYGHKASLFAPVIGWSLTGPPSVEIDWSGGWAHADEDAGTLNLYTGQISK